MNQFHVLSNMITLPFFGVVLLGEFLATTRIFDSSGKIYSMPQHLYTVWSNRIAGRYDGQFYLFLGDLSEDKHYTSALLWKNKLLHLHVLPFLTLWCLLSIQ